MVQARSLLFERFDGEVRRRLRLAEERAKQAVALHREQARALTASILGSPEASRARISAAAALVRERPAPPVSFLRLDSASLPPNLVGLVGCEGWWFAYRFDTTGLKPGQRLAHLVLTRNGENFQALSAEDSAHFLRLPAREEPSGRPTGLSVAAAHEQALAAIRDEISRAAQERSELELDSARERADRFAEDCLFESRRSAEHARASWEAARGALSNEGEPANRIKARAALERAARDYRRKLAALRAEEDSRYTEKERSLSALMERAKVGERHALIASAYFWLR
jgi:hypothetical protein